MDLSIIIVSWNVRDKLKENLRSIFDSTSETGLDFEVFVVDNNSSDKTAEMVAGEFPQIKLIANQENAGFGKANNQAIRQAQGRYLLFLNPDMKIFPDTLPAMVRWMDANQNASVAGCRLVDEQGKTIDDVRRFPELADQLAIVLKLPHFFPGILDRYLCRNFDYAQPQKVDSVRGAFFMARNVSGIVKEMVKRMPPPKNKDGYTVPFFDERYFLWFEEVDYCRQIKALGGEVWYAPAAKCVDFVGQSFKQVKKGATQKYFKDSMLKYFRKWQPWWQYCILAIAWPAGELMVWMGEAVKFKPKGKT